MIKNKNIKSIFIFFFPKEKYLKVFNFFSNKHQFCLKLHRHLNSFLFIFIYLNENN